MFQYFCPSCMGFSIFISGLKNILDPRDVSKLWLASAKAPVGDAPCSHCRNKMHSIAHVSDQKTVELDVCRYCHLIWLDTGEWQDLKKEAAAKPVEFPNQAYAKALLELESGKDTQMSFERVSPEFGWKAFASIVALPVEETEDNFHTQPWVTWLAIAICVLFGVWSLRDGIRLTWVVDHFGYNARLGLMGQLFTAVTSFFVHGGWMHLIGNMWALWVFGDNVEDYLGKIRYVLLLMFATIVGHFAFACFDPRSLDIPAVGASGGIFGLISFYLLSFPRRRFLIFFFFRFFAVPAWFFGLAFIFIKEFVGVAAEMRGLTAVSHLAHMGGATVGLIFFIMCRRLEIPKKVN